MERSRRGFRSIAGSRRSLMQYSLASRSLNMEWAPRGRRGSGGVIDRRPSRAASHTVEGSGSQAKSEGAMALSSSDRRRGSFWPARSSRGLELEAGTTSSEPSAGFIRLSSHGVVVRRSPRRLHRADELQASRRRSRCRARAAWSGHAGRSRWNATGRLGWRRRDRRVERRQRQPRIRSGGLMASRMDAV